MQITVVIPAINEEAGIERCVVSAWESGCREVILADGGSTDGTVDIARSLSCRVIHSPLGRDKQQNAAAQLASGEVLLFLHADNWLAPAACSQIRQALDTGPAICGAFRQRIQAEGVAYRAIEWGNAWRATWLGIPYGDQGIFVRRQSFFDVGGFPNATLLEDVLLMKRLKKIAPPILLPGPIYVSARRWQEKGIARQTLTNWSILARHALGAPPDRLARSYSRHG